MNVLIVVKGISSHRRGRGLIDSLINNLPVDLHSSGYRFRGPGKKPKPRFERGDPGINESDRFRKEYDIAYSKSADAHDRVRADKRLVQRARSEPTCLKQKFAARVVTNAMKGKIN